MKGKYQIFLVCSTAKYLNVEGDRNAWMNYSYKTCWLCPTEISTNGPFWVLEMCSWVDPFHVWTVLHGYTLLARNESGNCCHWDEFSNFSENNQIWAKLWLFIVKDKLHIFTIMGGRGDALTCRAFWHWLVEHCTARLKCVGHQLDLCS